MGNEERLKLLLSQGKHQSQGRGEKLKSGFQTVSKPSKVFYQALLQQLWLSGDYKSLCRLRDVRIEIDNR